MNIQIINTIQTFLSRVQLQGAEAPALVQCMHALDNLKHGIAQAQQQQANLTPTPTPTPPPVGASPSASPLVAPGPLI